MISQHYSSENKKEQLDQITIHSWNEGIKVNNKKLILTKLLQEKDTKGQSSLIQKMIPAKLL